MDKIKQFLKPFRNFPKPKTFFKKRRVFIAVATFIIVGITSFIFKDQIVYLATQGADPVAYWKLDEGQGTTVYTSVGAENGTLGAGASGPSWVTEDQCISGKCLKFDGTNDFVNLGDALAASNSTLGSMSFWFKSIKTDAVQPRIMVYVHNSADTVEDGFGGGREMHVNLTTSNQVQFFVESWVSGTDLNIISPSTYNDTKWHHVSAVWDQSGTGLGYLYVDGNVVGTGSMATVNSYTLSGNVYLARSVSADYRMFGGYIDEVKVYNYARTAEQVKADFASQGSVNGVSARFGDDEMSRKLSNGLVGYWKMDESSWGTVADASGNNNSGSVSGGLSPVVGGKYGNGGDFDGANDYISVPTHSTLEPTAITVSAWIKATAPPATFEGIVEKGRINQSDNKGYILEINTSGQARFDIQNSASDRGVATSTSIVTNNIWNHVVGTWDGTYIRIYVNGVQEGSPALQTAITHNGQALYIGKDTSDSDGPDVRVFDGLIDEVRIYSRAIDPLEVRALYAFTPGPVAHWKLDENSGTTVTDSASGGYTGTLGTGDSSPKWTAGKYGNALLFDGTNDYIGFGDTLSQTGGLTLSAWIKSSDSANNNYIVSKYRAVADERGYALITTAGKLQMLLGTASDSATSITSNGNVTTGSWVHVAGTIGDDSVMKLYINGVLDNSATYTGTRQTATICDVQIGAYGDSDLKNSFFHGNIDDVKIYNYSLTPGQIISDMNAGHPAPGSPIGSALAHYKLDEGYGTTVNNFGNAGSTLNGTFGAGTSAPTWTPSGKYGKGLVFDGSSDYVNIPSSTAWNLTDFTLSSWVYITAGQNTSWNNIIRKDNVSEPGTRKTWSLRTSYNAGNDMPEFGLYDGTKESRASSTTALTTGWYHIVGVRNASSTLKLYVNGNLVVGVTDATTGAFDNVTNVTLGGLRNSVYPFSEKFRGTIDEVKVYNFALTADQVKLEYNRGQAQVMGAGSTGLGGTSPDNSSSRSYCVPGDTSTCNPPIGEWLFNEGVGTTTYDTSGTNPGNFGPGTSAPTWTSGKFGKALSFDGTSDYVETTSSTSIVTGAFTMSGWVYFNREKDYQGVFGKFQDCAGSPVTFLDFCIGAGAGGTMWAMVTNSAGSTTVQNTITESYAGQWMHLTMVWDGVSNLKFYKNGILRDSDTTALTLSTDHPVRMGTKIGNGRDIDGKIDEVRLYNYARTAAQVAWEYNRGAPVGYYKMDECTGTVIGDWGQGANGGYNGNTGTLTIGASGSQTTAGTCATSGAWANGATGKRGASLNFDGTDDYISLGSTSSESQGSITAWVKTVSATDTYTIIGSADTSGTTRYFHLRIGGNAVSIAQRDNDTEDNFVATKTISTGTWNHITLTSDGSTYRIYINGVLSPLTTIGGSNTGDWFDNVTGADNLMIGLLRRTSDSYPFYGQMDEVKIFNYPLTPAQIKTEMNSGAVRFE